MKRSVAIGDDAVRLHEELQQRVVAFERDRSLLPIDQLPRRLQVLDELDAHFPGPMPSYPGAAPAAAELCRRAKELADRLEELNNALYTNIRAELQLGKGPSALLRWLPALGFDTDSLEPVTGFSYDLVDEFVRGVLRLEEPRAPLTASDPEMVFYQPTPARHIFRLLKLTGLTDRDVLIDLGSGLGHVPLLAGLCTPAESVGVEIESSYIESSRTCGQQLRLDRVTFEQEDARRADLSRGTVFYLHTPFTGATMQMVLRRLRDESARRHVRVCTFGPCTSDLTSQTWLHALTSAQTDQIAVFSSRP